MRPAELEPHHDDGQHGEKPGKQAVDVKSRTRFNRTKQVPHSGQSPEPRSEVHDIRIANPDPPVRNNTGKRRLVPEIVVQRHNPEIEILAHCGYHVLDAADGTAKLVTR